MMILCHARSRLAVHLLARCRYVLAGQMLHKLLSLVVKDEVGFDAQGYYS